MISFLQKLLEKIPAPWRYIVEVGAVVIFLFVFFWLFNQVQACGYSKARKDYEAKETAAKTERDKLIGQIEQRDKEILELESQKAQYKTLAEQGVKLDQEHAKQIEEVTTQEAKDLEEARKDMDCRTRAANTVALLRTAKPPIILDLAAVIRKQCSG